MHEWTNNEVTLLYNRIIASENSVANLEREGKSQVDFLAREVAKLIDSIWKHESLLQICDKSIKDLRSSKQDKNEVSTPAKKGWFW